MRRFSLVATLVITLLLTLVPTARAAPSCGVRWGSLGRSNPLYSGRQVVLDARAGGHRCFDRFVVEFGPHEPAPRGVTPGFHVGYVPRLHADGSGKPIALKGGAALQVIVHARAYDEDTGHPTIPVDRAGDVIVPVGGAFRTLRQVKYAGTFEGQTTFGLGVRARLPFRVFRLPGPGSRTRVVVDVAHRWPAGS
ncbi:MAG: hypothetical protein M4D85_06675 [Actinomycetota bacterium]|nr:hypothetical protein [Actinomycetota bacterium]